MSVAHKAQSPFYPGQPVPVEYFVGRDREVARLRRALDEVKAGKPQAVFISGSYGIGKSSLAKLIGTLGERDYGLIYLHALLGTAQRTDDIGEKLVESLMSKPALQPDWQEKIRGWLSQYIGKQTLFGVTVDLEKLKPDSPSITRGTLPFLDELVRRFSADEVIGVVLVLDEINGLAAAPAFAHYLKDLVDTNALRNQPVPLLLIVCGTEERYSEIVAGHEPVARIFQIAHLDAMSDPESLSFFRDAFARVGLAVEPPADRALAKYGGGLPKVMHILGDKAFWQAQGDVVSADTATFAVFEAAEDIGRQFVAPLYQQLRSERYRSILPKLAHDILPKLGLDLAQSPTFKRADVTPQLTDDERRVFDNLLRKLRELKLIRSGSERGEYEFTDRLTPLYLVMQGAREASGHAKSHG